MPIKGEGWEFHIVRQYEQRRPSDGKRRTVGRYQVFHDGVKQTGTASQALLRKPAVPAPTSRPRTIAVSRKGAILCSLRMAPSMSRSASKIREHFSKSQARY